MIEKETLLSEIQIIKQALEQFYETPYGCLYAPLDTQAIESCRRLADKVKALRPTMFVLAGIGGSNMGVLALMQAVKGIFYNESAPAFYAADTIDDDMNTELLSLVTRELDRGGIVILCIVTKSGTTTETVINGSLLLECLKKKRPHDYHKYCIIITDEGSPLYKVAEKNNYELLVIPRKVGGRYSIFSAVGLFPLMVLGIDTDALIDGARSMLTKSLSVTLEQNPAAQSAVTLFRAYHEGVTIHDIFAFSPALLMLGNWYKQLIGESLGKKYNREGLLVEVGISPTVSLGTVDLHSVVQLYLAGPRQRITTFLRIEDEPETLKVPENEISILVRGLPLQHVTAIKTAIFQGVVAAYKKVDRPFMVVPLKNKSSYSIGEFMMMKMVETILLGRLFSINPFDQPEVELYKEETRKIIDTF